MSTTVGFCGSMQNMCKAGNNANNNFYFWYSTKENKIKMLFLLTIFFNSVEMYLSHF